MGNAGSPGGAGGGGGGTFEIEVTGTLTLAGTLSAAGGNGTAGTPAPLPDANSAGETPRQTTGAGPNPGTYGPDPGQSGESTFESNAGDGGDGAVGGRGGNGGNGARGGPGGGGAGGTILVRANGLTQLPGAVLYVAGGLSGGGANRAANGRAALLDSKVFRQGFSGYSYGQADLHDFATVATDVAAVPGVQDGSLVLTKKENLFTRTQYVLPRLNACTYGFVAKFTYNLERPASGPWADGFGFYLKPVSAQVDTANNQVGGYATGLGVEFITYSNPRFQVRVNNTVAPGPFLRSPRTDNTVVPVVIEYRTAPGQPGTLTVWEEGQIILNQIPVNYTPQPTDVFAFAARTGGFAETLRLDDVEVRPLTKKPASNLTARSLGLTGGILRTEVKWDTEAGGLYDLYISTDLQNWAFSRTYTATGPTFAITSIGQPSTQPRYFFRVARQQ